MKDISKMRPSGNPVKKWPKWYKDQLYFYMEDLSEEQRVIACKVIKLLDESVANGVTMIKHRCSGIPLPEGFVHNSDELLLEAINLYESIGIK